MTILNGTRSSLPKKWRYVAIAWRNTSILLRVEGTDLPIDFDKTLEVRCGWLRQWKTLRIEVHDGGLQEARRAIPAKARHPRAKFNFHIELVA